MISRLDLRGYCGEKNREAAKREIASFLRNGSLCLFLGAGVSSSADFPTWLEIAQHCVAKKRLITKLAREKKITLSKRSITNDLLIALEMVRTACSDDNQFMDIVKEYFIAKVPQYDYEIAKNLLFVALGALVMPSVRGTISEVVTYNFDDMMEWYMHIHGFTIQRVTKLPFLEKRCDVRIYHPHGYIPVAKSHFPGSPTGDGSDHIVFDLYAYECLMASKVNAWNQVLSAIIKRQIPLMVGLSFNDPLHRQLFNQVKTEMEKEPSWKTGNSWRPTGILLNIEKEIKGQEGDLIKRGIAPVAFKEYDEIWEFLLSIRQIAAH